MHHTHGTCAVRGLHALYLAHARVRSNIFFGGGASSGPVINTHTQFNSLFSRTVRVSQQEKRKTNLDFTEARDSEQQWQQLGHMQVSTSLQTDNHASIPLLSFYRPDALPANVLSVFSILFGTCQQQCSLSLPVLQQLVESVAASVSELTMLMLLQTLSLSSHL